MNNKEILQKAKELVELLEKQEETGNVELSTLKRGDVFHTTGKRKYKVLEQYGDTTKIISLDLVKEKDYFVLTTNVDHQFQKAGFLEERIFATQGDYGRIQCMKGCHPRTYDAVSMFAQMVQAEKDCKIPSYMVPKCPVCGGPMAMNLRCDQYFVEDEQWNEAAENYGKYLKQLKKGKAVLLELGVGFNTPSIIRFPFEKMVREHKNTELIRLNRDEAVIPESFGDRGIGINRDLCDSLRDITIEVKKISADHLQDS